MRRVTHVIPARAQYDKAESMLSMMGAIPDSRMIMQLSSDYVLMNIDPQLDTVGVYMMQRGERLSQTDYEILALTIRELCDEFRNVVKIYMPESAIRKVVSTKVVGFDLAVSVEE